MHGLVQIQTHEHMHHCTPTDTNLHTCIASGGAHTCAQVVHTHSCIHAGTNVYIHRYIINACTLAHIHKYTTYAILKLNNGAVE